MTLLFMNAALVLCYWEEWLLVMKYGDFEMKYYTSPIKVLSKN
jgi:hypothetical protein